MTLTYKEKAALTTERGIQCMDYPATLIPTERHTDITLRHTKQTLTHTHTHKTDTHSHTYTQPQTDKYQLTQTARHNTPSHTLSHAHTY